ncbi:MAG: hypothetical protein ACFB4I_25120 [Cyanophyceae cyanobacterium]
MIDAIAIHLQQSLLIDKALQVSNEHKNQGVRRKKFPAARRIVECSWLIAIINNQPQTLKAAAGMISGGCFEQAQFLIHRVNKFSSLFLRRLLGLRRTHCIDPNQL